MDEHSLTLNVCDALIGYITLVDQSWQKRSDAAGGGDVDTSGASSGVDIEDLAKFVLYFRNYVVRGHQEKEEILFEAMTAGRESDHGLVPVLLQEHETIRGLVDQLEKLSEKWDDIKVIQVAAKLCELKDKHIQREEKGLLPMVKNRLAGEEIESLVPRFQRMDSVWGQERKELEALARNLCAKYPWSQDSLAQPQQ